MQSLLLADIGENSHIVSWQLIAWPDSQKAHTASTCASCHDSRLNIGGMRLGDSVKQNVPTLIGKNRKAGRQMLQVKHRDGSYTVMELALLARSWLLVCPHKLTGAHSKGGPRR